MEQEDEDSSEEESSDEEDVPAKVQPAKAAKPATAQPMDVRIWISCFGLSEFGVGYSCLRPSTRVTYNQEEEYQAV